MKGNRIFKWFAPSTCNPDYVPDWWFDIEEIVSQEGDMILVELEVSVFGKEVAEGEAIPLLKKIQLTRKLHSSAPFRPPDLVFEPLRDEWQWTAGITPARAFIVLQKAEDRVVITWAIDNHGDVEVTFSGPGDFRIAFRK